MEKKTYAKPALGIETFIPNAYCNVCFDLLCEVALLNETPDDPNMYSWGRNGSNNSPRHKKNRDHTGCGWEDNQVIRIDENTGAITVEEHNVPEQTTPAKCTFTSPANLNVDNVLTTPRIEWTTVADNGNTYYHYGHAIAHDGTNNPLHS